MKCYLVFPVDLRGYSVSIAQVEAGDIKAYPVHWVLEMTPDVTYPSRSGWFEA